MAGMEGCLVEKEENPVGACSPKEEIRERGKRKQLQIGGCTVNQRGVGVSDEGENSTKEMVCLHSISSSPKRQKKLDPQMSGLGTKAGK